MYVGVCISTYLNCNVGNKNCHTFFMLIRNFLYSIFSNLNNKLLFLCRVFFSSYFSPTALKLFTDIHKKCIKLKFVFFLVPHVWQRFSSLPIPEWVQTLKIKKLHIVFFSPFMNLFLGFFVYFVTDKRRMQKKYLRNFPLFL